MNDHDKDRSDSHRAALDARDWLVRLTSGALTDAELDQFKRWRDCRPEHAAAFERERIFWNRLGSIDAMATWPQVRQHRPVVNRRLFLGGSLAAAAIGVIVAPRLQLWLDADYIVPTGDQTELSLPDGSLAALNTGSAIKVDFRAGLRLVHLLRGEAEFQIAPAVDRSIFRVAAAGGNTDSNTAGRISVATNDDMTTVAVVDGEASVFSPATPDVSDLSFHRLVKVATTRQTSYRQGMSPRDPLAADLEMVLAWRQGKIIFEGRPFAAAVNELGRYVSEPVILRPGINREIAISGIFSTREPLAALQSLAKTQALSVRRIPGVAIIIA